MDPKEVKKIDPAVVLLERCRRKLIRALKVEVCDLAECLGAMRREECLFCGRDRDRLYTSRVHLKARSRAAQLAYGFIRGRTYEQVESGTTRTRPNWNLVLEYVARHVQEPSNVWGQRFAEWVDDSGLPGNMLPIAWIIAHKAG